MKLVVFDVDGTLTNTNEVDALCFVRTVTEVLGIDLANTRWSGFTSVTDSGIVRELYQQHLGRSPSADEVTSLRGRFVAFLEEAAAQMPAAFGPIPGAAGALERLRRDPGWALAIATGCWQASAELKLRSAGLACGPLPAAFAEDACVREDIVRTAVARAMQTYGQAGFDRIVSVGDGPWDVTAAHRPALRRCAA
jgi:phosphoglycolate phosphatase-like HAD superfamily hydrolase